MGGKNKKPKLENMPSTGERQEETGTGAAVDTQTHITEGTPCLLKGGDVEAEVRVEINPTGVCAGAKAEAGEMLHS